MAVSIIDVAKAAGVSHMTVSRVLSGSRHVRPANVAAVLKAVDELGYIAPLRKPGPKPKGRRKKLRNVFLIVPSRPDLPRDPGETFLGSGLGRSLVAGVTGVADSHGVQVEIVRPELNGDPFDAQGGDGLIVICHPGAVAAPLEVTEPDLPQAVLAQRSPSRPACDCVAVNDFMGGEMAVGHFLKHGASRLAIVASYPERAAPLDRLAGFRHAAGVRNVPSHYVGPITYYAKGPDRPPIIDGSPKVLVDQLMALPHMPDGLAVGVPSVNDLYAELRSRGIEPVRSNPRPGKSVVIAAPATAELIVAPPDPMPHRVAYSGVAAGELLMTQLLRRNAYPNDPPTHLLIAPAFLD